MCSLKVCSWDKIWDVFCGYGVRCMMRKREEKLEILGWSCRSGGGSKCSNFEVPPLYLMLICICVVATVSATSKGAELSCE